MDDKNNENNNENVYLNLLIEKYDFIEAIFIIETKGNEMCYSKNKKILEKFDKFGKIALEKLLNFEFNINIVQNKGNKIKSITTFYNNYVIYQRTINNMTNIHIICNKENYNHEIIKTIIYDLTIKINFVFKELEKEK